MRLLYPYLVTAATCCVSIFAGHYIPGIREGSTPFLLANLPPMLGAWLGRIYCGLAASFFMAVCCNIFFISDTDPHSATITLIFLVQSVICVIFVTLIKQQKAKVKQTNVFVATLAHELRNPMATIGNCLEILSSRPDPIVLDALRVINRNFVHLNHLVNDLMDLGRIEQDKVALNRERILVHAVIEQAIESVRSEITRRGYTLKVECPPEPIYIEGDSVRVCQVLSNILSNSVKYTERQDGMIQITVNLEPNFVAIGVIDNGIGIEKKLIPHLFEPFFQATNSGHRCGGLGLGLPLAKKLTERHGGTLNIYSAGTNQGTTVVCRFPRYLGSAPGTDHGEAQPHQEEKKRLKILVVDDMADAVQTMRLVLENSGHIVFTATSGREAIESARVNEPDVILLDISLPDINGYDVCRQIREKHNGSRNIIAITGHGYAEDKEKSKRAGFNHHLTKPIRMKDLDNAMLPPGQKGSHPCPS